MNIDKNFKMLELIASEIVIPVKSSRIAAGIFYKNELLGLGINSYKTDPFQAKFSRHPKAIHLHAEVAAIKSALRLRDDLSSCTLIVVRVTKKKKDKYELGLAMPCEGCYKCIIQFNIKNVIYSTLTGKETRR
jgi:tRNA(Arg) A34 adenosine deaminase TadA